METQYLTYFLLALLATGLIYACFTDIKRREIDNWLVAAIAISAPLFWWATGLSFWPGMAIQIGLCLVTFLIFALFFAMGAMGGGDVKLLAALALWAPPMLFLKLLVVMAILGGVVTIIFMIEHKMRKKQGNIEIPYGLAISAAAIWVFGERYFNAFLQ